MERSQEEFERISRAIKKEMEQFDVMRLKDFRDMVVQYLEDLMTSQQQVSESGLGPSVVLLTSSLS